MFFTRIVHVLFINMKIYVILSVNLHQINGPYPSIIDVFFNNLDKKICTRFANYIIVYRLRS